MPKSSILAAGVVSSFLISAAYADPMIKKGNRELSLHISPDFEGAIGDTIFCKPVTGCSSGIGSRLA